MKQMPDGIFPTMLVLYTDENRIDYDGMRQLIEWYLANGVHGIFALCHSTETHKLSLSERCELACFVTKIVNGRVPVVTAGAISDNIGSQLAEVCEILGAHPDAFVFIRNRLGKSFEEFRANIDRIIQELPADLPLGIYECPYPFKQFLTDDELRYAVSTGRFVFLKDTCCDVDVMRRRAEIARGSSFKLYNANCATYYESLGFGYSGFSGVMANFHPRLYAWVAEHPDDPRAFILDKYLGMTSVIEARCYPVCAKKYLKTHEGLDISDFSRSTRDETIPALAYELEALNYLTKYCESLIDC